MSLFGCEVTARDHLDLLQIARLTLERIEKLEQRVRNLENGNRK